MEIKRYEIGLAREWDEFVEHARQGSFLFKRGYMDYHADRFADFSLMAMEGGTVKAVLPANRRGEDVYSHQGLTYGGWLTSVRGFDGTVMLSVWGQMMDFLRGEGVRRLHYKCVPWIYCACPSEEDRYALFRAGARLTACQLSSAIDLRDPVGFDSNARRNLRRAVGCGVTVEVSDDYDAYWEVLSGVLQSRYGTAPVHTVDEMRLLAGRFPENIRLYVARGRDGAVLGGVVMYFTRHVAHAQYIAASPEGKCSGVLPLVFARIMEDCGGMAYFDFGVSCERGGAYLNEGLLRQKSGFGGRGVTYDSYCVEVE